MVMRELMGLQHQPSSSNAEAVVVVTFGIRSVVINIGISPQLTVI